MNLGVIGLVLIAVTLGAIVLACWRYGTTYLTRWTPLALVLAYYAALVLWPHPSVLALTRGAPLREGEAVQLLLLGLALLVGVGELIARLNRSVRNNHALRAELALLRGER